MSTRSNPDEVLRVVDLILEHAEELSHESLGVITMGIEHANNIDEALRRRISEGSMPAGGDAFFADDAAEPFFIKNLERVQGDERDAIILSVGYGKLPDGRMQYRFGPLNQSGGERRLNVAVTRARSRLTLASSFNSDEMDPARTRSVGADLLRRYIAYAASGGEDLADDTVSTIPMNGFELDIHTRLERAGIPLTSQYGVSGYRIDFAAAHPEYPGRMVLAIEADGARYHSTPTARDRDRLRQEVLENLGWTFHRIWSTEWFNNPEAEVQRAVAAWQRAVVRSDSGGGSRRARAPVSAPAADSGPRRGHRPRVRADQKIHEYTMSELIALAKWIESDGLLRTEDEVLAEMMAELGFRRRGANIVAALTRAIRLARRG